MANFICSRKMRQLLYNEANLATSDGLPSPNGKPRDARHEAKLIRIRLTIEGPSRVDHEVLDIRQSSHHRLQALRLTCKHKYLQTSQILQITQQWTVFTLAARLSASDK